MVAGSFGASTHRPHPACHTRRSHSLASDVFSLPSSASGDPDCWCLTPSVPWVTRRVADDGVVRTAARVRTLNVASSFSAVPRCFARLISELLASPRFTRKSFELGDLFAVDPSKWKRRHHVGGRTANHAVADWPLHRARVTKGVSNEIQTLRTCDVHYCGTATCRARGSPKQG